jgi:hypothetical protein
MSEPYLIIVGGPTGSGKGSLPLKVIQYLGLNPSYVQIIIDNLVEGNTYYSEKVREIISKLPPDLDVVKAFLNPSPELQEKMGTAYFTARKEVDCDTGELCTLLPPSVRGNCNTCDSKNDKEMEKAFINGQNIVFETTMTHVPTWIMEKYREQIAKYEIIISYSVVDLCELLNRNKSRAVESLKEFLKDPTKNPPRLPDIREYEYKKTLNGIIKVFKDLNKNPEIESNGVRLLLFDNNTEDSKVLYDNTMDPILEGEMAIDEYNTNQSCRGSTATAALGGYKKKLNKRSKRSKRLNKKSKRLNKKSKRSKKSNRKISKKKSKRSKRK